jgi:hypothetical protein
MVCHRKKRAYSIELTLKKIGIFMKKERFCRTESHSQASYNTNWILVMFHESENSTIECILQFSNNPGWTGNKGLTLEKLRWFVNNLVKNFSKWAINFHLRSYNSHVMYDPLPGYQLLTTCIVGSILLITS